MRTIAFFDIDGTVSIASWKIFTSFFYNKKTFSLLKNRSIPYFFVTGRTRWGKKEELEMNFYGIPAPQGVVIGGGAKILLKNTSGELTEDQHFTKEAKKYWDPRAYISKIKSLSIPFLHTIRLYKNLPLIQIRIALAPINKLLETMTTLQKILGEEIKVTCSEGLLLPNTNNFFSGAIFILPKTGGKDQALKYILNQHCHSKLPAESIGMTNKINTYIFGDAAIDIPMLSLQSTDKYKIYPYLVNPTPLAKQLAVKYPSIHIIYDEGPRAIFKIMNPDNKLSPTQNNSARKIIRVFEPFLDKIINKNYSANDISFLGLKKTIHGLKEIKNGNKIKGFWHYGFGNFMDILDGIRARKLQTTNYKLQTMVPMGTTNIPGQLVDAYCDRAKEFYQLYLRGKYIPALSCILPSIARAQAEIEGKIVQENDAKGGSMLNRTKLLMQALILLILNDHKKSSKIDEDIYQKNIATYKKRRELIKTYALPKNILEQPTIENKSNNMLRIKALERFLLFIQILQEENKIIEEKLKLEKNLYAEYKIWKNNYIEDYLKINIKENRKKYDFKNYTELSLKNNPIFLNFWD